MRRCDKYIILNFHNTIYLLYCKKILSKESSKIIKYVLSNFRVFHLFTGYHNVTRIE